jgi:hypothetical protein
VAAVEEAFLGDHGGAVELVAVVEALVEVAIEVVGEGDGAALDSVGFDVAAEAGFHRAPFLIKFPGGVSPKPLRFCHLAKVPPLNIRFQAGCNSNKKTKEIRRFVSAVSSLAPIKMVAGWENSIANYIAFGMREMDGFRG